MITKQGFTLIEILIVIVIIGITVGFALIAFGDFGASRRLQFAAEQLANTIKLSQQQAILESSTLGLRVDNTGYQILKFQNTTWNPISNKGIFKLTYFPSNTTINLITTNAPSIGTPAILIHSSGDLTPFTIEFAINKNPVTTTLTGSQNGELKLTATTK